MRPISTAPEYVKAAHQRLRARLMSEIEVPQSDYSVHDLLTKNYWFTYKNKQYSIPFPKVKDFYYLAEISQKEDFKNNLLALWLLYHSDDRIYEGYDVPIWKLWSGIVRIPKWKIKAERLTELIEKTSELMSFAVKSKPSGYERYFANKDMIIAIACKMGVSVEDVLNWPVPKYAAILHNLDTISFVEGVMSEDTGRGRRYDSSNSVDWFAERGLGVPETG